MSPSPALPGGESRRWAWAGQHGAGQSTLAAGSSISQSPSRAQQGAPLSSRPAPILHRLVPSFKADDPLPRPDITRRQARRHAHVAGARGRATAARGGKEHNQPPRDLEETDITAACTGDFLQVGLTLCHQRGGRPLWLGLPARVHSHVVCRSGKPVEPLIQDNECGIPPGQIERLKHEWAHEGTTWENHTFPFPIHAMLVDRQVRQQTRHGRHRQRGRHRPRRNAGRDWFGGGTTNAGGLGETRDERLSRHTARAETMRLRRPCQVLQAGATF